MMPTIRIDDDVLEGLKSLAEPFTDTPNSVIRRLLEARRVQLGKASSTQGAPRSQKADTKAERSLASARGALTPQPIYETFLLYVLATKFRGRATKHDATRAVIELMKTNGFISAADQVRVSTGETKAENTIAWGRNALKDAGLISRDSEKGVWELTPKGLDQSKEVQLPTADAS